MLTIWKYAIESYCELEIPIHSQILCVQVQHDEPQMWVFCDPSTTKEKRRFRCYGTGHSIDGNPGEYIGTFQLSRGALVFHVFEQCEPKAIN